jgi:site-specific recombinase XerD
MARWDGAAPTTSRHGLRERVLWQMLYKTAARAAEILTFNVEDLDPEFRRARVTSKGGAVDRGRVHGADTSRATYSPSCGHEPVP